MGFEPMNNGFAIRPLSPLGYTATARAGRGTLSPIAHAVGTRARPAKLPIAGDTSHLYLYRFGRPAASGTACLLPDRTRSPCEGKETIRRRLNPYGRWTLESSTCLVRSGSSKQFRPATACIARWSSRTSTSERLRTGGGTERGRRGRECRVGPDGGDGRFAHGHSGFY